MRIEKTKDGRLKIWFGSIFVGYYYSKEQILKRIWKNSNKKRSSS